MITVAAAAALRGSRFARMSRGTDCQVRRRPIGCARKNLDLRISKRKSWCHDDRQLTEKIADAVSCLANALGGVVLVGIGEEPNATKFSRCPHANVNTSWLVARVHDNTHPPVTCRAIDVTDLLTELRSTPSANAYALIIERTKGLTG